MIPRFDTDGSFLGSMEFDPSCTHPKDQLKRVGMCSMGCCDDFLCQACGKRIRLECPD